MGRTTRCRDSTDCTQLELANEVVADVLIETHMNDRRFANMTRAEMAAYALGRVDAANNLRLTYLPSDDGVRNWIRSTCEVWSRVVARLGEA